MHQMGMVLDSASGIRWGVRMDLTVTSHLAATGRVDDDQPASCLGVAREGEVGPAQVEIPVLRFSSNPPTFLPTFVCPSVDLKYA